MELSRINEVKEVRFKKNGAEWPSDTICSCPLVNSLPAPADLASTPDPDASATTGARESVS